MASIWLNAVGLLPAGSPDLFQTWAPTHTPRAETILVQIRICLLLSALIATHVNENVYRAKRISIVQ
jgi:hypothetical protein